MSIQFIYRRFSYHRFPYPESFTNENLAIFILGITRAKILCLIISRCRDAADVYRGYYGERWKLSAAAVQSLILNFCLFTNDFGFYRDITFFFFTNTYLQIYKSLCKFTKKIYKSSFFLNLQIVFKIYKWSVNLQTI